MLANRSESISRLKDFGVLEKIPANQIFEDVDRAIEWAEDNLLSDVLDEALPAEEMRLEQSGILNNFDPDEIAALKARLTRVAHPKGGVIFSQAIAAPICLSSREERPAPTFIRPLGVKSGS